MHHKEGKNHHKTEIKKEKFKPHVICEIEARATEEKIGAQKTWKKKFTRASDERKAVQKIRKK